MNIKWKERGMKQAPVNSTGCKLCLIKHHNLGQAGGNWANINQRKIWKLDQDNWMDKWTSKRLEGVTESPYFPFSVAPSSSPAPHSHHALNSLNYEIFGKRKKMQFRIGRGDMTNIYNEARAQNINHIYAANRLFSRNLSSIRNLCIVHIHSWVVFEASKRVSLSTIFLGCWTYVSTTTSTTTMKTVTNDHYDERTIHFHLVHSSNQRNRSTCVRSIRTHKLMQTSSWNGFFVVLWIPSKWQRYTWVGFQKYIPVAQPQFTAPKCKSSVNIQHRRYHRFVL